MSDSTEAKDLVLRQLDALIVTMTKAAEADAPLDMETWVTTVPANPEHFCGAAACICGYQSLSGDLTAFPEAAYASRDPYYQQGIKGAHEHGEVYFNTLHSISSEISRDMRRASIALLASTHLAGSIYLAEAEERRHGAQESELFTSEELRTLTHLNSDYPSAADALEYLELCREKVINYCKERNI